MASTRFKGLIGLAVSGALLVSSAEGAAAPNLPSSAQVSPWATLTALTAGAPAAAVCGAAAATAAAAQPSGAGCVLPAVDASPPPVASAPPPPSPLVPATAGYGITPLLLGLVAVAAAIGFYLAVKGNGHRTPNSPA